MIKLTNVNKSYNKKRANELHVINNTSLDLPNKGLITLLGNSGCGKTTLLNAIGALDKIDSGQIYIDGKLLSKKSSNANDEIRNAYIGYIFQNFNLIEKKTVFENVAIVLKMIGIKDPEEINQRVMFILKKVSMDTYKNRPVTALSGGQRQRVAIARALVKSPKIIIADEPTGNLDSKNTVEIMNIIKTISKERLVLLVTHEKDLAKFYSDQIIEIKDGYVASNKPNDNNEGLSYCFDNKIYLKDLESHKTIENNQLKVDYYTDAPLKDLSLKVVVKNNNIYISLPEGFRQGSDSVELIDDHQKEITKDIYENYTFDYGPINGKNKYTSIYSWWDIIKEGYKKVFSYSVLKKILLLGFVFSAMIIIYSISSVDAAKNVNDGDFLETHRDYLSVKSPKVTVESFEKYKKMDGVSYVLPGDGTMYFNFPTDDFYQSNNSSVSVNGAVADRKMLAQNQVVMGKMPKGDMEVAVDKILLDKLLEQQDINQVGVNDYEGFLGRQVKGGSYGDLTVTAVVDTGSAACFMDRDLFFDVLRANPKEDQKVSQVVDFNGPLLNKEFSLKTGALPEDNQVLLPYESYGEYYIGSKIDFKVLGESLRVSGFYESKEPSPENFYVNRRTFENSYIEGSENLIIAPENKGEMIEKLTSLKVPFTDIYESEKNKFISAKEEQTHATFLLAVIMLIISIVEIYLILRASFLSRVKEVGVLRAIGLKKWDVYKMFIGEIIAMTTLTSLPAFLIMGYFIYSVADIPWIGDMLVMNPLVVLKSILIVGLANFVFGLLPVAMVMRKTPAEILARPDI